MTLNVQCVENVDAILDPVVKYLNSGLNALDLFDTQFLIVPTAGVRSWLSPHVAARLGASSNYQDGVMANVRVGYIGMLNSILRDGVNDESDAWSIERVTMAILHVIHDRDAEKDPLIIKYGGHLRAARAMADRFDRYAARRPQMIREWERAFNVGSEIGRDNAQVEWQYNLWREVRAVIGDSSWPARTEELCKRLRSGEALSGLPNKLMVAGIETISVANIEILQALSSVIDVEVILVHPSPELFSQWSTLASAVEPTPGLAPARLDDGHVVPDSDVLVNTWLRGAFELQMVLASQGVEFLPSPKPVSEKSVGTLLERMQAAIRQPSLVTADTFSRTDLSVQIHRAHNLARQVEVLRDALLHSFNDLENLQPHEVLILCADIEAAAPLLQATFDQPMSINSGRTVKIPLVVADRSLRDNSSGADLLGNVLSLIGSRFDVASVLRIATHEIVMREFRLTQEDIDVWLRHIESTRVRWGVDEIQRVNAGLDAVGITAHSWKQMLERALLGAMLPDAELPAFELGDIVPLTHVDTSEIDSLTALTEILGILAVLEMETLTTQPVRTWCDLVENVLIRLCGSSSTEIDDARAAVKIFHDSTILTKSSGPSELHELVQFSEFADLLSQKLSTTPGHQPLRTGAVTATSFVPLRSVPFRVICLLGLDDGTLSIGESEGDDIVAQEQLMGDADPRVDTRRIILDTLVAASDQIIITCNGRSIKNNSSVPLVTPLAELVDFCGRLGIEVPVDSDKTSDIEYVHPRHAGGDLNFVKNQGPVPSLIWSHDVAVLASVEGSVSRSKTTLVEIPSALPQTIIALGKLERLSLDPLAYYLRETLEIDTDYEEAPDGAVLPLDMKEFALGKLAEKLVAASPDGELELVRKDWEAAAIASDTLPVGAFAARKLVDAFKVAVAVSEIAKMCKVLSIAPDPIEFVIQLPSGSAIDCHLANVIEVDGEGIVYSIRYDSFGKKEMKNMELRLLALCAAGKNVRKALVILREDIKSGGVKDIAAVVNQISLDPSVTQQVAINRLTALAMCEPTARVVPCGFFADTASELQKSGSIKTDNVVDAFDKCVADNFSFPKSKECLVFGGSPDIDEAFPLGGKLVATVFDAIFSLGESELSANLKSGLREWILK